MITTDILTFLKINMEKKTKIKTLIATVFWLLVIYGILFLAFKNQ